MTKGRSIRTVSTACFTSRYVSPVLVALALAVSIQQASAASLFSSDLVVADMNTTVSATGFCAGGAQHVGNFGTGSVPNVSCSGIGWSETASASSQFGSLRGLADLRFSNFNVAPQITEVLFEALAESSFTDTLTFSQGAFWEPTFSITGQSVVIFDGVSHPFNGLCFDLFNAGCLVYRLGTETLRYRIPASGIINIHPHLKIDLELIAGSNQLPFDQPLNYDQYVDISNTVRFVSSRVLDANGQPISGATITSDSGYDYVGGSTEPGPPAPPPGPAPSVPEPATLALLGIGLAGLTASRRRKLG